MTYSFTPRALTLLQDLPRPRREQVAGFAMRLAKADGRETASMDDVKSALLCAGREFLPEEAP